MQCLDWTHAYCLAALLSFGLTPLGCNDVLGFQEGKPFPVDAGFVEEKVDDGGPDSRDATSNSEAGPVPEIDGGCQAGYVHCGSTCVPPGGCCDSTQCKSGESCVSNVCACNEGTKSCGTQCIPSSQCCEARDCANGATCKDGTCSCPSGQHECTGACVSNLDPKHCGTSCSACMPPNGGDATCDGTKCGATCPMGQKLCAGTCIPTQNACMNQCPAMTHDCDGACAPNNDVNSCGTSCTPCPTPSNGSATCDGTKCGIQCNATFKACGTQCIPTSGCCMTAECPMNAICSGNQCQCGNGFKLCKGACIPESACCTDGECQANAACISNQCQCKSTFKDCNGTCIPSGSCCTNNDCTNGYQCSGYTCQCQLPNIVCQGKCLNGGTDTNNCGACGHVCTSGCTQSHCACLTPDMNVLPNAGFNSDLSGWAGPPVVWSTDDAVECPNSGSAHFRLLTTNQVSGEVFHSGCFPISPTSSTYNSGARVRSLPGSAAGLVWIEVYFQSGVDCGGYTTAFIDARTSSLVIPTTDWITFANPVITGVTGVASVFFEVHLKKTDQSSVPLDVEVDMAYLAPTPSVGWK